MKQSNEPIDFVIAWVDGNDQKWKREKEWYARRDEKQQSRVYAITGKNDIVIGIIYSTGFAV